MIKRLRKALDLSAEKVADRAGLSKRTILSAEGEDHVVMRPANLDSVLEALGESHDTYWDKVAVDWDGSMSSHLRVRILEMLRRLDEVQLLDLHHHVTSTYGIEPEGHVKAPPHMAPKGTKATSRRTDGTPRKK